jgi:hypothetical protein
MLLQSPLQKLWATWVLSVDLEFEML